MRYFSSLFYSCCQKQMRFSGMHFSAEEIISKNFPARFLIGYTYLSFTNIKVFLFSVYLLLFLLSLVQILIRLQNHSTLCQQKLLVQNQNYILKNGFLNMLMIIKKYS